MIASFFSKLSFVRKIITMLIMVSSLSIFITSTAFISLEYLLAQNQLKQHIKLLNEMVSENIVAAVAFDDSFAATESLSIFKADSSILYAEVTDINDNVLASYGELTLEMQQEASQHYYIQSTKPLYFDDENVGDILLIASKNEFYSRITLYILIAFLVFLSAVVIAIILSMNMHKHLSAPILKLSRTAKKIATSSNYSLRVDIKDDDEIGELASAFNTMLNQVENRNDALESEVKKRTAELEKANQKLSKLAFYDNLTGLPNRVLLEDRLKQSIIRNQREKKVIALLFIDLDGFKNVNDTYGHSTGDQVLINTAKHLSTQCREQDTIARLGGDEFVMLLELSKHEDLSFVCKRIIKNFNTDMSTDKASTLVTLSIGAAIYGEGNKDFDTLKHHADTAMYQVKQQGKNGFQIYSELQ